MPSAGNATRRQAERRLDTDRRLGCCSMRAAVNRAEAVERSSARVIADRPLQCRWAFSTNIKQQQRREVRPCDPGRGASGQQTVPLSARVRPLSDGEERRPGTLAESRRAVLPCCGSSLAMTAECASRRLLTPIGWREKFSRQPSLVGGSDGLTNGAQYRRIGRIDARII